METSDFYKKVAALVIPMALQNLINVGVMATDVIMLGKVSETVLSGASLGGQVAFILNLILFGLASGASVLTAQYWGKGDKDSIEQIIAIGIDFSLVVGTIFAVITLVAPEQIMHIFTNDLEVIAEGKKYLQILAFSYPISATTMTFLNLLKSMERVVISTICYGTSLVFNFCINAILIFGLFGVPALGIVGAAIGTLSARLLELVIVAIYTYRIRNFIRIRPRYMLRIDRVLLGDFLKFSSPVVMNELLWGLGYAANAAIMGRLGQSAVAANSVTQVTRQLSMVVVFGLSTAAAVMIGKAIGEKQMEVAKEYATQFIRLALVGGMVGGALILFIRPLVIRGMGFEGTTAMYANTFLTMMACYVLMQAMNCVFIIGIFRAGGDTKFGLYIDIVSMWCGSILLGVIAAFVLELDVVYVYAILLLDEAIKIPLTIYRYSKKKWLRNVTR